MITSSEGINLIKQFEGCRLEAYKCLPSERYFTIGYGHYGPDVKIGMRINQAYAEELLKKDLKIYEDRVNKYSYYNWSQSEFDSLVSFCYNIGSIDQLTANGTRSKAVIAEKMLLYVNSGGQKIQGLVNRRKKEHALFISEQKATTEQIILPEPVLKKGVKSKQRVTQLQHAMNTLFGKSIAEDGSFGPITRAILMDIQEASGNLAIDGSYGPKTYAYFREVLDEYNSL